MILDDKVIMRPLPIPPPAYYSQSSPSLHSTSSTSPSFSKFNLSTLPPHILLQILYRTFPQSSRIPDQDTPELQRKTLYWLSTSLRLVNRALYTACMHILRSTYLRAYQALLRPPYTSDPFPISSGPPAYEIDGSLTFEYQTIPEESPLQTIQRETLVLDRFITLKVREDVFSDESSLHLEGDDKFRDLFSLAQPQARLEDLVRVGGLKEGVISVPGMSVPGGRSPASSQSSFHDSDAVAVTYPLPASTSQVVNNQSSTRSPGFFSSLKKFAFPYPPSPSPSTPPLKSYPTTSKPIQPIPFSFLSVTFTFQSVRLIQRKEDGSRRCVAEVPRNRPTAGGGGRKESLEVMAEGLVRALKEDLEERSIG